MTGIAFRRFISALATYLVVLHAVGMGAMAAPAAGVPLLVICSVEADAPHPTTPDHTSAEHAPCALCGLGACAIAPPPANALAAPLAVAIAVASSAAGSVASVLVPDSARPRGPPLAV